MICNGRNYEGGIYCLYRLIIMGWDVLFGGFLNIIISSFMSMLIYQLSSIVQVIGWSMWFSEYLFLERSWAKDESTLKVWDTLI